VTNNTLRVLSILWIDPFFPIIMVIKELLV
jgi:hypothetical protein